MANIINYHFLFKNTFSNYVNATSPYIHTLNAEHFLYCSPFLILF